MPVVTRLPAKHAPSVGTSLAALTEPPPSAAAPGRPPCDRLLRRAEMTHKVGMSYTAVHKAMKAGEFPQPVQLPGGWAVAWRESELDAWIAALPRAEGAPCA